jgi:hypothetical protein
VSIRLVDGKLLLVNGSLASSDTCCCNDPPCSGPCDEENPCPEGCECCDGVCQAEPCCESYKYLYYETFEDEIGETERWQDCPPVSRSGPAGTIASVGGGEQTIVCGDEITVSASVDSGLLIGGGQRTGCIYRYGFYSVVDDCGTPGPVLIPGFQFCIPWFDARFASLAWDIFGACAVASGVDLCAENPLP